MWWMPWRLQAMKDVVACEKLRGARKQALIRRCPNGETRPFTDDFRGRFAARSVAKASFTQTSEKDGFDAHGAAKAFLLKQVRML